MHLGSIATLLLVMMTSSLAIPVPEDRKESPLAGENPEQLKEQVEDLAALASVALGAVEVEKRLEDEILQTGMEVLAKDAGDKKRQAEDVRELQGMVVRERRNIEFLTNIIGTIFGGSSGGGGDEGEEGEDGTRQGGSGSDLIGTLLRFVLGASGSSGGSSGGAPPGSPDEGGDNSSSPAADTDGRNEGGLFSPLRLLTDSISTVLRIKFSILRGLVSLASGLLSSR